MAEQPGATDSQDQAEAAINAGTAPSGGGGGTDLISDQKFKWSLNTSAQARSLAPRIYINLLEMTGGQIFQLLAQAKNIVTDPYNGMYDLQFIERLTLPFFSNLHHNNSNSWEPLSLENLASNVAGSLGGSVGAVAQGFVAGAKVAKSLYQAAVEPASKTESPHVWKDIGLETVSFGFTLYNTDFSTYGVHKAFVDKMVYWSTPFKKQFTFALPPALCEYEIPGIRRGLMASFNFSVTTKGQSVFYGSNVPDAYECTFSLTDLLMQTRNINPLSGPVAIGTALPGSQVPNTINVYTPTGAVAEAISQTRSQVSNLLSIGPTSSQGEE